MVPGETLNRLESVCQWILILTSTMMSYKYWALAVFRKWRRWWELFRHTCT